MNFNYKNINNKNNKINYLYINYWRFCLLLIISEDMTLTPFYLYWFKIKRRLILQRAYKNPFGVTVVSTIMFVILSQDKQVSSYQREFS